jgi:hypothetical protein
MKLKTIIWTAIVVNFISCSSPKPTLSTAAFYDIPQRFIKSDASGKDYFLAFGKGKNEKECKENAQIALLKELIYNGIQTGTSLPALLQDPNHVNEFKKDETNAIHKIMINPQIIQANYRAANKLKQAEAKNTNLNMSFEIGVNRRLLSSHLETFTKIK